MVWYVSYFKKNIKRSILFSLWNNFNRLYLTFLLGQILPVLCTWCKVILWLACEADNNVDLLLSCTCICSWSVINIIVLILMLNPFFFKQTFSCIVSHVIILSTDKDIWSLFIRWNCQRYGFPCSSTRLNPLYYLFKESLSCLGW